MSIGQSEGGQDMLTKTNFVKSPMPGTVVKVFVSIGQEVKEGDPLISVESMKMEYLIRATHDATIKEIRVSDSQFV
jgi:biotin carboxyl carrier protein